MAAPLCTRFLVFVVFIFSFVYLGGSNVQITDVNPLEFDGFLERNEYVLALLYDGGCVSETCKAGLKQLAAIGEGSSTGISNLQIVKVEGQTVASKYGVTTFPTILFFRQSYPLLLAEPDFMDVDDVTAWLDRNRDVSTRSLYEDDFEHLTQAAHGATTGDWFVLFYEPDAGDQLIALWEAVASRMKQRINVAKVDTMANRKLKERFRIVSTPTIIFFRLSKMYYYDLPEDFDSMVSFAEGWYKNARVESVPAEPTPFDHVVDAAVRFLQAHINEPHGKILFTGIGAVLFLILIIVVFGFCYTPKDKTE